MHNTNIIRLLPMGPCDESYYWGEAEEEEGG